MKKKRAISLFAMVLLCMSLVFSLGAKGAVSAKLEAVMQTPGYMPGEGSSNCYLFAKSVIYKVFGIDASINYHGYYDAETYRCDLVGRLYSSEDCSVDSCGGSDRAEQDALNRTLGGVDESNVARLLSKAMPGDVLQGHRGFNVHTMIILEVLKDDGGAVTGARVYHGNWMGQTAVTEYTCAYFAETYSHALSVYRAPNYAEADIGTRITFDACGGTVANAVKEIDYDATFGFLPVPERKGFVFDGWYTEAEGGILVTEKSTTDKDSLTLYAHWHTVETAAPADESACVALPSGGVTPAARVVLHTTETEPLPTQNK